MEEPNIKLPDALIAIIDTARHPSEYTAINVTFIRHEQCKSHIDVKAFVRETRRTGNDPDKDSAVPEFRFDRDCLNPGDVSIAPVDRRETAYMRFQPFSTVFRQWTSSSPPSTSLTLLLSGYPRRFLLRLHRGICGVAIDN